MVEELDVSEAVMNKVASEIAFWVQLWRTKGWGAPTSSQVDRSLHPFLLWVQHAPTAHTSVTPQSLYDLRDRYLRRRDALRNNLATKPPLPASFKGDAHIDAKSYITEGSTCGGSSGSQPPPLTAPQVTITEQDTKQAGETAAALGDGDHIHHPPSQDSSPAEFL
eukprot:7157464-Pyramimonas_sp.AAC.1